MSLIYQSCVICGSDHWEIRFNSTLLSDNGLNPDAFRCTSDAYGDHPQIVQCRVCGHVYTNPRWSDEELIKAYSIVQDDIYDEEHEGREITFRHHLADIEEKIGSEVGRQALDVGAYTGIFVDVANHAGWEAEGIEPSRWAVELARKRQIPIRHGTLESIDFQDRLFDIITMWDVIEHLPDPKHDAEIALNLLKAGGYLVVHTMDINSRTARLMGSRWPWLMDMHLHYFSRESLGNLLEDVGYEITWSGAQGRYLRIGYLASRLGGLNSAAGRTVRKISDFTGLSSRAMPVNFGDLFTIYARKPRGR